MNERIQKLKDQCWVEKRWDNDMWIEKHIDQEKFAELIVSDVLSEVGKFIRRNPGYWDEYGLVTDIAPIYAGVEYK